MLIRLVSHSHFHSLFYPPGTCLGQQLVNAQTQTEISVYTYMYLLMQIGIYVSMYIHAGAIFVFAGRIRIVCQLLLYKFCVRI